MALEPPTDSASDNRLTPNEVLAAEVVQALLDSDLVPQNKRDEVLEKLNGGAIVMGDWRLWAAILVEAEDLTEGGQANG